MRRLMPFASWLTVAMCALLAAAPHRSAAATAPQTQAGTPPSAKAEPPAFADLLAHPVSLRPELAGVHPRVFVTREGLVALRERARTTHRDEWQRVLASLPAMQGPPPPVPGPQERRSQNNVAFAIAGVSLAAAIEQQPQYMQAARQWVMAAIDYEPWGYTYNKPNVDLAAGHLLYAIGWSYDLLYDEWTPAERARIRASLERHAQLVADYFSPTKRGKRFTFTQNHTFIPTSGLGVAALALIGESPQAERWAALARAHHHRANMLLSPDGYYYEGIEYWIFSAPWLVHFADAWEHATGESLWELGPYRNWKYYLAHSLLPDGQNVFDFGDIWEGALTRARQGAEYNRVYPGGTLQSNFNVMYRVAARLRDPEAQAVAERYARAGHSNLEEYWTLLWRDPSLEAAPIERLPLSHHFDDMGVVFHRTSWNEDATAIAVKAGPPEGHRALALLSKTPEWRMSSGHAHPDAGSLIIYARGRYLTGDSGYAGQPRAQQHNTITVAGAGQGVEGDHDVWARLPVDRVRHIRILEAKWEQDGALDVTADATGAYATETGLAQFVRRVRFDGATAFTIEDHVRLDRAQPVQFYWHSDTPIVQDEGGYLLGGNGGASLLARFHSPVGFKVRVAPTEVLAPGKPGSITEGRAEVRGYHLEAETEAASDIRAVTTLVIRESEGTKER